MNTKEIYYEQDYKQSWKTNVIEILPFDEGYAVVLEETAFYPGGGGQPCDLGSINGQQVIEVFKKDNKIFHIVENKIQEIEVVCSIDQVRRFDLMQQHTGQHLLSAVFYKELQGQTNSFHLGLDYVTVDISIPNIHEETIKRMENRANQYIYDNIKIKNYLIDKDHLPDLPLRKQPKVEEDIRIVEIEGIDYSPCGGTHLETTGQLGLLKIIRTENYKGNTRVYFKCGNRALLDYQNKGQIIYYLSTKLSISEEEIIERVEKEIEKTKAMSREINEWKEKTAYWEAKNMIENNKNGLIAQIIDDKDFEEIEIISREINNYGDYIVLFASILDKKLILSQSGNASLHCGKFLREYLSKFEGRGGGNDKKAQAAFPSIVKLEEFYNFANIELTKLHR